jgi:hypothetical protein
MSKSQAKPSRAPQDNVAQLQENEKGTLGDLIIFPEKSQM